MDSISHFKSLTSELEAVKDRLQNFIGGAHWLSVGAWKESVLRQVLRKYLPASLTIGSGFVLGNQGLSTQIDVLIYDDSGPVLFRDGDLVIVTPDVVRAAIEVKTRIARSDLEEILLKADAIGKVLRTASRARTPFLGVFSYEDQPLDCAYLLESLKSTNGAYGYFPINGVSVGKNQFVRFWEFPPAGERVRYNHWHCYELEGISHAYFVHNVLEHLFPKSVLANNDIWYPVDGKESRLVDSLCRDEE